MTIDIPKNFRELPFNQREQFLIRYYVNARLKFPEISMSVPKFKSVLAKRGLLIVSMERQVMWEMGRARKSHPISERGFWDAITIQEGVPNIIAWWVQQINRFDAMVEGGTMMEFEL